MALRDISNISPITTKRKIIKKRLSDGTFKEYEYKSVRKQIDLVFTDVAEKVEFESKLEDAKCSLGCKSVKETFTTLLQIHDQDNEKLKDLPSCKPASSISNRQFNASSNIKLRKQLSDRRTVQFTVRPLSFIRFMN